MPSKLDALKSMTTVVADTGDMEAIGAFKPTDCTTNPTLILKAAQMPAYTHLVDEAIVWGKAHHAVASQVCDRLAVCADAGVFLISPFVGRILDWHMKATGETYTSETDPGVRSVRQIYSYYKAHGVSTVVMGASFRNAGEIEALAGCDRLTISPQLLQQLSEDKGDMPRRLDPAKTADAPAKLDLDEKTFRFMLNEDAMASEKLAEGIRLFARDLRDLRAMVSKRLVA